MKNILVISLILFQQVSFIFSQTDTSFIALRGFEDSLGHTHLYYSSKYLSISDEVDSTLYFYNLFNVNNNMISFSDRGYSIKYYPELFEQESKIEDIEFFNNDPSKYIFIKNSIGIDLDGKISRYDNNNVFNILGHFDDIYLSPKNSNHIYAVAGNLILQSFDKGLSWPDDSTIQIADNEIKYLTFSPFDASIIYGINPSKQLVKSIDKGKSFTQVTSLPDWEGDIKLLFDIDEKHIYATINRYEFNNYYSDILGLLYVSNNNGDTNSWALLRTEYNKISLCNDDSISGNIFLSVGNNIYESTDYGNTFTKFIELQHHASGLYKKHNGPLYAATSNKIIEILQDSTKIIKSKSMKNSLKYYPLAVGNKWFYNSTGVSYDIEPHPFSDNYFEEITKDTIDQNGTHYYFLTTKPYGDRYWIRLDSLTGSIYTKYSLDEENEYLHFSLSYNKGDELETNIGILYNVVESDTSLWKKKRYSKIYQLESLYTYQMQLVQDIGVVKKLNEFDFGYSTSKLLGCIINEIVYGDTVVGVKKEFNKFPAQFYLSQNYPNPFNPITTIKYIIPSKTVMLNSFQHLKDSEIPKQVRDDNVNVVLRVFDILGREVATLVNHRQNPGNYKVEFDASKLSSGIYYYQLTADSFIQTKKMILLK